MRVEKIDILESINREFALKWDVDVLVNNLPSIADSKLLFIMTLLIVEFKRLGKPNEILCIKKKVTDV
jgi:hypothetical protein